MGKETRSFKDVMNCLFGMVAAYLAAYDRKKKWWQTNRKQQDVLYWAGWVFFSVANFFHPYYTIMLAPPLAVLAALAIASGLKRPRRKGMIRGRAGCVTFYSWA
ncbi:hypothetical protein P3T70_03070 [Limosilactobacillus fermentum]|nr:hypothetical protein [Limosilactobacillus fermentum]WFA02498.1 hypothetical protein P3T70_03070 [Limosilactobacillus fermentum]